MMNSYTFGNGGLFIDESLLDIEKDEQDDIIKKKEIIINYLRTIRKKSGVSSNTYTFLQYIMNTEYKN